MKKQRNPKYSAQELARTKGAITRGLKVLEDKLKKFRCSSPEKWVEEVGGQSLSETFRARSTGEESSSSAKSEELIKTTAENEDFIKQKVGGIEEELLCFSGRVVSEAVDGWLEDLGRLEEGLQGLRRAVSKWDKDLRKPPRKILEGLAAFRNALEELGRDAELLTHTLPQAEPSKNLKTSLQGSLQIINEIENSMDLKNFNKNEVDRHFDSIQDELDRMKSALSEMSRQSPTLRQVHSSLDDVKREMKTNIKDLINLPDKCDESERDSTSRSELFANLEEKDFHDLDSVIGYEITDYILRREEEEIALMRYNYQERVDQPTTS